jgi:hypothetical protein
VARKTKPPTPEPQPAGGSPDPESIRDTLLRIIEIRSGVLLRLATDAPEPEQNEDGEVVTPPPFPAYEVQAYMAAVSNITGADLRELRELGKMSQASLDAAVAARKRLADAARGVAS